MLDVLRRTDSRLIEDTVKQRVTIDKRSYRDKFRKLNKLIDSNNQEHRNRQTATRANYKPEREARIKVQKEMQEERESLQAGGYKFYKNGIKFRAGDRRVHNCLCANYKTTKCTAKVISFLI